MTDYTQVKFTEQVLVKLGVQDPTEPVDGAARNYVQDRLTQTLEELEEDQLVDWDITGSIPGARYNALLMVMEGVLADAYGIAVDIDPRSGRAYPEAKGREALRSLIQGEYVTPAWERAYNF